MLEVSKRVAYIFTGQGAQYEGMFDGIKDYSVAQTLIKIVGETTGYDLLNDLFKESSRIQVGTVAYNLAMMAVTKAKYPQLPEPDYVAGHSAGEYSALVKGGAVALRAVFPLVKRRGYLMGKEGGKMAAILGRDIGEKIYLICQQTGPIPRAEIANFNCPGQVIISGSGESVDMATEKAKAEGFKVVSLNVPIASHSSLMKPAQPEYAEALKKTRFKKPGEVKIISNVTAKPYQSIAEIRQLLNEQLTSSVLWQQTIEYMISKGVETIIEFGPYQGKAGDGVLTGLLKRINQNISGYCVSNRASLEGLPEFLGNSI